MVKNAKLFKTGQIKISKNVVKTHCWCKTCNLIKLSYFLFFIEIKILKVESCTEYFNFCP